jgi:hypothetical protein
LLICINSRDANGEIGKQLGPSQDDRESPDRGFRVFPLFYSGFLSSKHYYHRRVSDLPDPMSRWEVFKLIFLGVFLSAVLTAGVVLIALRAANP